jgi:hypothetical protein
MRQVEIFVRDRNVRVKYKHNKFVKEYEWEDCQDLTQNFLLRLDKINKCAKNEINCLFKSKSDSASAPTIIALHREGRDSTTYRIVLITLKALEWAKAIKLVVKP